VSASRRLPPRSPGPIVAIYISESQRRSPFVFKINVSPKKMINYSDQHEKLGKAGPCWTTLGIVVSLLICLPYPASFKINVNYSSFSLFCILFWWIPVSGQVVRFVVSKRPCKKASNSCPSETRKLLAISPLDDPSNLSK
jgi:hypothetical protein